MSSVPENLPPILNGSMKGSFVHHTVGKRWPQIIGKIVDHMYRHRHSHVSMFKEKGDEDVKNVIAALSELVYRVGTDKPLLDLADNCENSGRWNKVLQRERERTTELTWYTCDWYIVECYLYRYVAGIFSNTITLRTFDPYAIQKQSTFIENISVAEAVGNYLLSTYANSEVDVLSQFIQISLWCNRCDLSMSCAGNSSVIFSPESITENFESKILSNQTSEVETILSGASGLRVDYILDNAGLELFGDLILCDYLLSVLNIGKIILHGKSIPWFVSDVTGTDFTWLLEILACSYNKNFRNLGERWTQMLNEGKLEFRTNSFWTLPFTYSEMKKEGPDLYSELEQSALVIIKGDLNYRKLIGDRKWPHATPLKVALRGFSPAPVLAVRTVKAEIVVGLDAKTIERIKNEYGDREDWMRTGEYGVIQFSN